MNVVPTPRTRAIAHRMIRTATEETGADAVLRLLPKLERDQVPALVGLLLTNTRLQAKMGRPRMRLEFSPEERKEANRRYKRGERDEEWTMPRWREYQRVNRRTYLARSRPRPTWAPAVDDGYRASVASERLSVDTTEVGPGGVAAPSPGLADRLDTTD